MSIIIPRRMNEDTAFQCTLCPAEFYADEKFQYERHVLNHPTEDLVPHSPRLQAPALFGDAGGDEDWTAWVNRHRESDPHGFERWGKTGDGKSSSGMGDG